MDFSFKTLTEFTDYFNSEEKCYQYLETKWWGGVPRCPKCGNEKHYKVKSRTKFDIPSYRCADRSCDKPYTVKTGSIFEGTQVELRKWFMAMYELVTSKKGISSIELATRIGVSQKCAWFMNHRIREMLGATANDEPMGEGGQVVEIDETYIGGKMANMSKSKRKAHKEGKTHSQMNKTTVMGYVVRGGELRLKKIIGREEVTSSMLDNVAKDAVIITDTASYYRGLQNIYPNHEFVDHSKEEYVRNGTIHTNTIEGAFSILDRAIMGIFHYVSPKHLQKYCDEISLKYNGREVSNLARFQTIIENSQIERITYRQLTKD